MKVSCPNCQASYRIDDSNIPYKGIYGRCPKCQEKFWITKESNTQPSSRARDGTLSSSRDSSSGSRTEEKDVAPRSTPVNRTPSPHPHISDVPKPQGIGGGILFFCVCLTIVGPLFSLGTMISSWEEAANIFTLFPSFRTIMYFESFAIGTILIYGFVVGCKVWGGDPNGKRLAQQYLKVRFFGFVGLEIAVILLMLKYPSQMIEAVATGAFGVAFREGVCFLVWWLYFKKSKRVKNTYDLNYLGTSACVNRWATISVLSIIVLFVAAAILIPQFAANRKSPPNLNEHIDEELPKHPTVERWLEDPEFMALTEERREKIIGNFFDAELATQSFRELPSEEQKQIREAFIDVHLGH